MGKQHWNRDAVAVQIMRGFSDTQIGEASGWNRRAVALVRRKLNARVFTNSTPYDEQIRRGCSRPDGGGHVRWVGPGSPDRAPRIRFHSREVAVTHVIFEQHHGKPPVGQVRPECGEKRCIAPTHLLDDLGRRKVRLALRAVYGMPRHWDVCSGCGSSWEDEGRVEDSLSLYCRKCTTLRARRNRQKGTGS